MNYEIMYTDTSDMVEFGTKRGDNLESFQEQ